MIYIYIIAGIVVVVAALYFFGVASQKATRKNAAENVGKAQAAFNDGNENAALGFVEKAFYAPGDGVYDGDDAKSALGALTLLQQILAKQQLTEPTEIGEAVQLLQNGVASGSDEITVPENVTAAIEKHLEEMTSDSGDTDGGFFSIEEGEDNDLNELSAEENKAVNQLGRMVFGSKDKLINTASEHLQTAKGQFRVNVLNQRGAGHFMNDDFQAAAQDYREAAELNPAQATNWSNLAEAYEKLLDKEGAIWAANKILAMDSAPKDETKIAKNIIRKFG